LSGLKNTNDNNAGSFQLVLEKLSKKYIICQEREKRCIWRNHGTEWTTGMGIPRYNALKGILHQQVMSLFQTVPALWSLASPLLPRCHVTQTIPEAK